MSTKNEKNHLWYLHHTSTGREYPLRIGYGILESSEVPYNKELTVRACQTGCKLYGRNGGCPPYSPNYDSLFAKYPFSNVIYVQLQTKCFPPKVLSGNFYVRWSFVETLLGSFATKLGRLLHSRLGGFFLSAGHCTGCGSGKCQFKTLSACANPAKRTFSMESTGIIVTKLMETMFDIPLQWFKKDPCPPTPTYMVKVVMLMAQSAVPFITFEQSVLETVESIGTGKILNNRDLQTLRCAVSPGENHHIYSQVHSRM